MAGDNISGLLSLRRHARVLSCATKVQLSPEDNKPWRRRCWSTRPWTVVGQSFHFMLSVLRASTCLRTLQLVSVEVKPCHQLVILSIPTLKSLVLDNTHFIPTTIEMPRSSITSLKLARGHRRALVEHTLRLLRDTLKTLNVEYMSVDIPLILETMKLPRLTCICTDTPGFTGSMPHTSSTITKLCITTWSTPFPLVLSDSAFPHLRELYSPWCIGVRLVPRRPVQVFHDIEAKEKRLVELQTLLALLSQSTRPIEELQLCTSDSIYHLLQLLATHTPQLRRLHLWTTRDRSFWGELLNSEESLIERNLNALTEIHFGFLYTLRSMSYLKSWCGILPTVCLKISPVLEVVRLSAGLTRAGAQWNIASVWNLSLRRIHTGEWEEFI